MLTFVSFYDLSIHPKMSDSNHKYSHEACKELPNHYRFESWPRDVYYKILYKLNKMRILIEFIDMYSSFFMSAVEEMLHSVP